MQPFSFSLQPVLDYKNHVKEEVAAELAKREEEAARAREILAGLKKEYLKVQEHLRQRQERRLSLAEITLARNFLEAQTGRIRQQASVVQAKEEEANQCRSRLVQVRKETTMLEKLREKKWGEYRRQCLKEEQLFLDERGVQEFVRRHEPANRLPVQR